MPGLNRERRIWLLALSTGVLGTFQYHLTQFSSKFDTFFGDRGDARGIVALCEHWHQAILGHADLLSPAMFYPVRGTLAYSEFLLGFGVPYSIVRATGLDMFSSLEVVVIVLSFLNYLACFVLLYRVLRFHYLAACAAAMFFAFNSPKFFQTGHLQLQFVVCLPLIFIFVLLFVRQAESLSQKRAFGLLFLAGLALNIQLLTAFYHAWFFIFWCFLLLSLALLFRKSRALIFNLIGKFWPALTAGAATFLLGAAPFTLIYLPAARKLEAYSYNNVTEMIPAWWSLLSMGDGNYIWGWLASIVRPDPAPAAWGELTIGIGIVTSLVWLGITVFGIWILIKGLRPSSVVTANEDCVRGKFSNDVYLFYSGLAILATTLFYVIGFKYVGGRSPWHLVYDYFPGATAIRAMSRYVIFLTLPMAIAFGFVLNYGITRVSAQKTAAAKARLIIVLFFLATFGTVEQFGIFKLGGTGFSKRVERSYLSAMAAKLPESCSAFYVAAKADDHHNAFEYHYDSMLIAVTKHIPTLNGSSSKFPAGWFGLYQVKDPAYEEHVKRWIEVNNIKGNVCRLELDPPVEAFDPRVASAVDDPEFFVRQQYRDLLNREPTSKEVNPVLEQFRNCKPGDASCDRVAISQNIFHETGFYDRGFFILRIYESGLGHMPGYDEFVAQMTRFRAYLDSQQPEAAKVKFIEEFIKSAEFVKRYEGLSDLEYEEKVLRTSQAGPSDGLREFMLGRGSPRAQILKKIVESDAVSRRTARREFVVMQYFGYLRRDPEPAGLEQWLTILDNTGDLRQVTSGFVNSIEYRQRFLAQH
jgi:uncharacterized protein DUF4214